MTLYFITGNKHKLDEAKLILGDDLQSTKLDLTEIQSMDSKVIISHKLKEAIKLHPDKHLFCEDVFFNIKSLNNFPGPLIKWWNQTINNQLTSDLIKQFDDYSAIAGAMIGYWDTKKMHFFEGKVEGIITQPKGESGFGFDPIFQPDGHNQTFAQMGIEKKSKVSHRAAALKNFQIFLNQNKK
ncbi:non-canonical purine NTP pyrophosphatase [archaeon]|jgi:inosine triphosphate pyrophosphatase|nr:non-canonical purine NTP pyrophosphatase [archaeon]MBT6698037.1 non-canonical purine NTP pyrophosphatase [archaeon]